MGWLVAAPDGLETAWMLVVWRSRWDSNPRYGITVHRISSPAHSTTLPPLLIRFAWCEGRNSNPSRLEYLQPAHVGPQNFGHHHGTILLLVVLQHRDQRPAHGQAGTVERVDQLVLALGALEAGLQAP